MAKEKENVYWSHFQVNDWNIYLAKTDEGICYIGSPNEPFSEVETWINKKIPNATLIKSNDSLENEMAELSEYIQGKRKNFTVKTELIGTDFQQAIWHASDTIPYGETRTYSELAEQINRPNAVRAVGTAIGANPLLFMIPCHRIVAKDGGLAGFRAGIDVKKALLTLESKNN